MSFRSRAPVTLAVKPTRQLHRMRSESCLETIPERTVPRPRSLGQLSLPPNEPLPPLPERSPLQLLKAPDTVQSQSSYAHTVEEHPRLPASNSSVDSGSVYSEDEGAEYGRSPGRNTLLMEDIELTLGRSIKRTPNLDDLSQLLGFRGRLQELGATFSPEGQMLTYGNPSKDAELDEMLRIGPLYDEQWNTHFHGNSNAPEADSSLEPELRVFEKMLQNEGVAFDDQHKRIDYGSSRPKLIYLSFKYDTMWKDWQDKMTQSMDPALRPLGTDSLIRKVNARSSLPAHAVEKQPGQPDGLGRAVSETISTLPGSPLREVDSHLSAPTEVVEKQPKLRDSPGHTVSETIGTCPSPVIECQALLSAQEVPHPQATGSVRSAHPHGLATSSPPLRHGSSPLHVANTASTIMTDDELEALRDGMSNSAEAMLTGRGRQHEHAGVLAALVDDERRRAEIRERADQQQREEALAASGDKKKGKGPWSRLKAMIRMKKIKAL
ncbi:hypothetical protein C7974DRAFT_97725 [Boeremia exigua]|uniref:uncharacterized protein n=1 Tax=Boeremia exigua TaxID=749465 RepID=UPI001E8DB5F0|nr:uncharacterized protein C7974DRAFT_97725 [Boeremia exigua]KAH6642238.1 hypothetical protein C7974DRAFT_97725 [Boeremia exigua]